MPKGVYKLPNITNEPIKSYAPGSPERAALKEKLNEIHNQVVDIPMIIGGKEIRTDKLADIRPPHDHQHLLGHYHQGDASHVQLAIDAAMKAKPAWEKMNWESRAAIFLKAAELIAGPYRQILNAVTMLGQSKNAFRQRSTVFVNWLISIVSMLKICTIFIICNPTRRQASGIVRYGAR